MYVELDGNEKMTILVIDQSESRRKLVEMALHRFGWLINQATWASADELVVAISNSDIIVMLESPDVLDEMVNARSNIFESRVFIGKFPVMPSHLANLESIDLTLSSYECLDSYIDALIKSITAVSYRRFFPVTENHQMKTILLQAKRSAASSAPVLILGETGVGKEVIAQYIHYNSRNANGPFVAVNCAAIPETMIEAVLFGYEKGAFTSAINHHVGKFEKANNGTLFLDEIGEMSIDLQAKLLRVLQNNEIERIGGKDLVKVNVRIITATNVNLMKEIELGNFRSDLYYRINVINLKCLPLRERREDISRLAEFFTTLYSQDVGTQITLTSEALTRLISYDWPGNVRELQNVIYRAAVMCNDNVIRLNDIVFDTDYVAGKITMLDNAQSLRSTEAEAIVKVLKETKGCRSDAAKRLRISPRTLRYKISKLKEVGFDVP
jgi:two-component system response regulator FlrC